jgi:hypothetical protein
MRYPEGYLWDYPGFPSIFIPYGKTNDFFYSGHVGLCVIVFHELITAKKYRWAAYPFCAGTL